MSSGGDETSVASAGNPPAPSPTVEQPQQPGMGSIVKGLIFRALIMYVIVSFMRRPDPNQTANQQATEVTINGKKVYRGAAQNFFMMEAPMDLYVYLAPSERLFSVIPQGKDRDKLGASKVPPPVWVLRDIRYGDWKAGPEEDGSFTEFLEFPTPEPLQRNRSMFLHAILVPAGRSPDPLDSNFAGPHGVSRFIQLNKFKKRTYRKTVNLLTGETSLTPEELEKAEKTPNEIINHWHPNLTINVVVDHTPWTRGSIPAPLDEFIDFTPDGHNYLPILYMNNYWNLNRDYQPLNHTVKKLSLHLTFQPLSLFKFQMYAAQSHQQKSGPNAWAKWLSGAEEEEDEGDSDVMKETMMETNVIILALTMVVSILHMIFEFLAFKNDIQFWRDRKSLEGLSVRSVFFNVFQTVVVLLYVLDNDTNFVIRVSCFISLAIELWKIPKVSDVKIDYDHKILGIVPRIHLEDKGSYVESSTREYDQLAFRYLSWALFPLLGGYAVYSVIYNEHRGWYSFVLSMLYGFLLTFGFIMMTPQLFINYKLKSVAHLPWRMLTYKFLNTFIDDIFAFVIKMPTLYRLGCFRDDIVFFIFLYQRYIYRVDPTRMNEFGFSQEMLDKKASEGGQPPAPPVENGGENIVEEDEHEGESKKTK